MSGEPGENLSILFLGNTTLYIRDLSTAESPGIFIDAFVSRPKFMLTPLNHPARMDVMNQTGIEVGDRVDSTLTDAGVRDVSWVIPLHSHFDHVLDAPYVANEFGANLVATPTTLHIAESMGFQDLTVHPVAGTPDQVETLDTGEFLVRLEPATHTDTGLAGYLFAPRCKYYKQELGSQFSTPQFAREYVEGQSYNVHLWHKSSGKQIYVLSGFPKKDPEDTQWPESLLGADLVFLSVPLVRDMGDREYSDFWDAMEEKSKWVVPLHWDDFDEQLDKSRCQETAPLENCLTPLFILKPTMSKMHCDLFESDNIELHWLTAFGEIRM